jgi:hypothetical protein
MDVGGWLRSLGLGQYEELAHLARAGVVKPVHVRRTPSVRESSSKKLFGQRVTLENQIRGLAVVSGIRLPGALTAAFIDKALRASEGIAGLRGDRVRSSRFESCVARLRTHGSRNLLADIA